MLDIAPEVDWLHRNPVLQSESVALYRWSSGAGFFPDFLVAVKDRKAGCGVALVEFKGPRLQQYDKEKSGAMHTLYGRTFMVGVGAKDKKELRLFRLVDGDLVDDGLFEVGRLRYEWGQTMRQHRPWLPLAQTRLKCAAWSRKSAAIGGTFSSDQA